jgi:flagellar basal body P-ring formation protein FlgA
VTIFRHLPLGLVMLPASLAAQSFHDHADIDARAAQAVGSSGSVQPVDRRLKLATCAQPLQTDAVARDAVTVRCDTRGWRVRVLIAGASVATGKPIIRRGDPVTVNFVASGFSVTASGVSESDARAGERVRVRVEQKANPIMGEAIDEGMVRVGTLK